MFDIAHLNEFEKSLSESVTWNGLNAKKWYSYITNEFSERLDYRFMRTDFLDQNKMSSLTDKEISIAILSWGAMNRKHGSSLLRHEEWLNLVSDIRYGRVASRKDAYQAFYELMKSRKLTGMGPAYFTKLICFLNRDLNGYIMDQWTAKSINLLLMKPLVKLTSSGLVSKSNTATTYEEFCLGIESLAKIIKKNPLDTEEMLFSNGGPKKGLWRQHVIDNYIAKTKNSTRNHVKTSGGNKINNQTKEANMEPIDYEKALNFFNEHEISMPTLGRRVDIRVRKQNDSMHLKNSKENEYNVDKILWGKVMDRMRSLAIENRSTSKYYTLGDQEPYWKECPNKVLAVYIPAIVRFINIEQKKISNN